MKKCGKHTNKYNATEVKSTIAVLGLIQEKGNRIKKEYVSHERTTSRNNGQADGWATITAEVSV